MSLIDYTLIDYVALLVWNGFFFNEKIFIHHRNSSLRFGIWGLLLLVHKESAKLNGGMNGLNGATAMNFQNPVGWTSFQGKVRR